MNNIKADITNGFDSLKAHYIYKFSSGVWDLDKREITENKKINISSGENIVQTHAFEFLVKEFVVNLRENIYGESFEDLLPLDLERLIFPEPLQKGEKLSVLIEEQEKKELKRLEKKYKK